MHFVYAYIYMCMYKLIVIYTFVHARMNTYVSSYLQQLHIYSIYEIFYS